MSEKVLIAMSGGVDSSVAAFLMQKGGFDCVGATLRLLDAADTQDAQAVADRLGIPFHVFDMRQEFRREVMEDFVDCYRAGLTPNPCVVCNRRIKFGLLLDKAEELGCRYVVTGHYTRIGRDEKTGRFVLRKALDPGKDQSYFLYGLSQDQLSRILFPLGKMPKTEVRDIACEQGFVNAQKRDSQDICFIPDGDYRAFMQSFTGEEMCAGAFLDMDGNIVGQHIGAAGYTLGQRKGLGLAMGEPVYVCGKNMQENTVTVGPESALFHRALLADDWNWMTVDALREPVRVKAKTRSRQAEQWATVYPESENVCRVEFDEPQRAMTPGQAVVLYDQDTVVGGGTIRQIL